MRVFCALFFSLSLLCACARISGGKRGGGEIFARGANVEGFPKRDVDSRSIRWMRIAFLRSNARFDGCAGVNRARFFRRFMRASGEDPPFFLALVFSSSSQNALSLKRVVILLL